MRGRGYIHLSQTPASRLAPGTHTHTHTHTHTRAFIRTHSHIHTHIFTQFDTHTFICTLTHAFTHSHIHTLSNMHSHSRIHTHFHIHSCILSHTHIHTLLHRLTHICTHTLSHKHMHIHNSHTLTPTHSHCLLTQFITDLLNTEDLRPQPDPSHYLLLCKGTQGTALSPPHLGQAGRQVQLASGALPLAGHR